MTTDSTPSRINHLRLQVVASPDGAALLHVWDVELGGDPATLIVPMGEVAELGAHGSIRDLYVEDAPARSLISDHQLCRGKRHVLGS